MAWQKFAPRTRAEGLVSGNGRIEAVESHVAAKSAGRLKEILAHEGDFVTAGQVVALMDTQSLHAERKQAEAQLQQAQAAIATARSQLGQRQSEKTAAEALVAQREAELHAVRRRAARIIELAAGRVASQQEADDARTAVDSASAALSAARAHVAATVAAITTAGTQITNARAAVQAAHAAVARIQTEIDDSTLTVPCDGRVQYIVARAGEVIGAGGRVLNVVDLGDVYMTLFLPTAVVGRLAIGTEARIVLDAAPERVIPAQVSFVADVAQFTPKTVETAGEREKLMFRVHAQIPRDLLVKYRDHVKTGLPGVAYVRLDQETAWPHRLEQNLLQ
ncbi:MAG TPA: HlyD family efflux transporter periplasmic adaptor subunit [Burkholderiaceae bacterium]|nr:HlyD family efflux transporter periplasmic adaptor subunit [Burkholderiaceae bacterium]